MEKFKLKIVDHKFQSKQPEVIEILLRKSELVCLFDLYHFVNGVKKTGKKIPKFFDEYIDLMNTNNLKIKCKKADINSNLGFFELSPFQVQMFIQVLFNTANTFYSLAKHEDSKKETSKIKKDAQECGELGSSIENQARKQGWYVDDYPEFDLRRN